MLLYFYLAAEIFQLLVFKDGEIKIEIIFASIYEWTDSFLTAHEGHVININSIRLGASQTTILDWRDYHIIQ